VLLDALDALAAHRSALILVGAQAVYLRTRASVLIAAPFTRDADLAINPANLAETPALEALMRGAGFRPMGGGQVGSWVRSTPIAGDEQLVEVDLLVPDGVAGGSGRRSVDLPGHDRLVARRTVGLEAALADKGPLRVASLEEGDDRAYDVAVAGPGALLVAKLHKISERLADSRSGDRARDKDASDVYRLFQTTSVDAMAGALRQALESAVAREVTETAVSRLRSIFGRPNATGITMAARAAAAMDAEARTIEATCIAYVMSLADRLGDAASARSG
jgi:Nucleotidyltransferase